MSLDRAGDLAYSERRPFSVVVDRKERCWRTKGRDAREADMVAQSFQG
jgi:hypothetical protein